MQTQGMVEVSVEYSDDRDDISTATVRLFMPVLPREGEYLVFEVPPGVSARGQTHLSLKVQEIRHVFTFGSTPGACTRGSEIDTFTGAWLTGEELLETLLAHTAVHWVNLNDGYGERYPQREISV